MNWISPHLAFDECSSGMKRKVHWDDEENGESEMEPFEEASETDVSDDEQNNDEEPRIKDVLENLSQSVSRKRASDLLHSMATILGPTWAITSKKPLNSRNKHR